VQDAHMVGCPDSLKREHEMTDSSINNVDLLVNNGSSSTSQNIEQNQQPKEGVTSNLGDKVLHRTKSHNVNEVGVS